MRLGRVCLALAWCGLVAAAAGRAQTLSPPIAEYRQKADGTLSLANNGDAPLVAILEVRSFSVDGDGNLRYGPPDPGIIVKLGSNSFVIPPHQVHYVFYKAACAPAPCWFAIINNLTTANRVTSGLRINIVLPHLVYVYQKAKLKKGDLRVEVSPAKGDRQYQLKFTNMSGKLERVETIEPKGFKAAETSGGFPLFPHQTRSVVVGAGLPTKKPLFRVRFGGGLRLDVPLLERLPVKVVPG